jgi:hypothetical protein
MEAALGSTARLLCACSDRERMQEPALPSTPPNTQDPSCMKQAHRRASLQVTVPDRQGSCNVGFRWTARAQRWWRASFGSNLTAEPIRQCSGIADPHRRAGRRRDLAAALAGGVRQRSWVVETERGRVVTFAHDSQIRIRTSKLKTAPNSSNPRLTSSMKRS